MIRYILIIIALFIVYYAVKSVIRSAIGAYTKDERKSRLPGDEMVLDPECRTYVVKRRAVTRRISNNLCYFCSEDCAKKYAERDRA
jgi:hypothetical protein